MTVAFSPHWFFPFNLSDDLSLMNSTDVNPGIIFAFWPQL